MKLQQRADFISKTLEETYPKLSRTFLDHQDPYTLLIAVLLSAQCTDKRVNLVTPALFAAANQPRAMVALGHEKIEVLIRSCGLAPRKARAIHTLSQQLLANFAGEVPVDIDALESLAGVGHKTASVVMAQAFDIPTFPVDTHIHRLAQRWKLTNGRSVEQTERDCKKLFPRTRWINLHKQIIQYGRDHCSARGCQGMTCFICRALFPNRRTAVATKK